MTHMFLVQIIQRQEKLLHDVSYLFFVEALYFRHDLRYISSTDQLLDYVKVVTVLEDLEDLLDMWVIDFFLSVNFVAL